MEDFSQSLNTGVFFAGNDYLLTGDISIANNYRLHWRRPDGNFYIDPTPIESVLHPSAGGFEYFFNPDYAQGGLNFILGTSHRYYGLGAIRIMNGKINPTKIGLFPIYTESLMPPGYTTFDPTHSLTSANTFVTFDNSYNRFTQYTATSVYLHRVIHGEGDGATYDFPVSKVEISDGKTSVFTTIEPLASTATFDASGTVCKYNKVKVYPGVETAVNTNGFTEHYFFNGITNAEAGNNFPIGPSGTDYNAYSQLLAGVNYLTKVYNNLGAVVLETKNALQISYKDISVGGNIVHRAYYARPYSTEQIRDGITTKIQLQNDPLTGQILNRTTQRPNDDVIREEFKYWWVDYDASRTKNMLNLVSQTKKLINGQVTECNVVKYKNWGVNSVPSQWKGYAWNRSGSSDFTAWAEATNPSVADWRLISTVDVMNETNGLVLQSTDGRGITSSTIWSSTRQQILANATSAGANQILFDGFEETSGVNINTTDSKTGKNSFSGSYLVTLPSAGSYSLSYWLRPNGSTLWGLVQTSISANTTIGGTGTLIDEVRLHPAVADMTSVSYDKFGNVISECDATNQIIYYEYDEFQRIKLLRDKDRNIVKTHTYLIGN